MTTQETLDVHLKIIRDLMAKCPQVDSENIEKFFLIGFEVGQACAKAEQVKKEIELWNTKYLKDKEMK